MPPAVAIAGAAVVGAGATIYAGSKAAKAQKKAAALASTTARETNDANLAENARQYDTTRADYAPYREVGYGALDKLAGISGVTRSDGSTGYNDGGFTTSPGYAFRRDEGLKAIDRSRAARGLLNSGGADKARMRYADGLASSEYDAYAGRLAQLAGVGASATGATAAAGAGTAAANQNSRNTASGTIANAQMAAGNATASSYALTGAAINKGLSGLASSYANYQQRPETF